MSFGLSAREYDEVLARIVVPLRNVGAKVFCYGSRARGDHSHYSDLDLMVETSSDVSSLLSEIREHFSRSNFPIKIDLVDLRDFSDAYRSGYLNDRIELVASD